VYIVAHAETTINVVVKNTPVSLKQYGNPSAPVPKIPFIKFTVAWFTEFVLLLFFGVDGTDAFFSTPPLFVTVGDFDPPPPPPPPPPLPGALPLAPNSSSSYPNDPPSPLGDPPLVVVPCPPRRRNDDDASSPGRYISLDDDFPLAPTVELSPPRISSSSPPPKGDDDDVSGEFVGLCDDDESIECAPTMLPKKKSRTADVVPLMYYY
tara:strand:- start:213 stop:836 length:624 start_codon:yes stop_codon:yes gene_type:complete